MFKDLLNKYLFLYNLVIDQNFKWERDPNTMAESIQLHNDVMRNLLEQYRGYEVKTEGGIYSIFLIILIKYYSFIYNLFL